MLNSDSDGENPQKMIVKPVAQERQSKMKILYQGLANIDKYAIGCCLKISRLFNVEDLVHSAIYDDEDQRVGISDAPAILVIRKQQMQLMKVIKYICFYMGLLSCVYLFQSLFCLIYLDKNDYLDNYFHEDYANELYEYSIQIEYMKTVHAISLCAVCTLELFYFLKHRIVTRSHYLQITAVTILITIIYFIPIGYISWMAFRQLGSQFETQEQGYVQDPDESEF